MSRNRLAVTALPKFIAYCETLGYAQELPKGDWEVARLVGHGKRVIIHRRIANNAGTDLTHLTLDRYGEVLFNQWIRDRRQDNGMA